MSDETPLNHTEIAAQGRAIEEAEWHLPAKFRLDADLLELPPKELKKRDPAMFKLWQKIQAQEKQWEAAANTPSGSPSPQDIHRARAVQRAEELRNDIERLKKQIGAALVSGGDIDVAELQAAVLALRHKRAENLATIGRFDLASQEEPDPQYRDHYLSILKAVVKDDEERCGHEVVRGSGEHASLTVPTWNAHEEVFSIKHGKVVTLMKCAVPGCDFMNAIESPPAHVQTMRTMRQSAGNVRGIRDLSPEDAATLLANKGHTTAKLLK